MTDGRTQRFRRLPKAIETRARAMLLAGDGTKAVRRTLGIDMDTGARIRNDLIRERGTIYCACGKPSSHFGWCPPRIARSPKRIAWMLGRMRDVGRLNIYVPSRPRYERPFIEDESETEIRPLINNRYVLSLDSPLFFSGGYSTLRSGELSPLEILMEKEQQQTKGELWEEK